jgi:hypothetical protein
LIYGKPGTIDAANSAGGGGKAAYVYTGGKKRETAAGPAVNLDSNMARPIGG